ncbi:hypothetical protein, partial [Mesorhizobium sp. M0586]|uniref:hypothetical protein n=1 Tax=unclassified Mesorhizobium TaxID=325217 RepID=UPI003338ECFD
MSVSKARKWRHEAVTAVRRAMTSACSVHDFLDTCGQPVCAHRSPKKVRENRQGSSLCGQSNYDAFQKGGYRYWRDVRDRGGRLRG